MIRTKIEEIHCDTADSSLLFKWTQILNLEITIFKSKLRLGAQSSYVVKYFEGSNAVKTTST